MACCNEGVCNDDDRRVTVSISTGGMGDIGRARQEEHRSGERADLSSLLRFIGDKITQFEKDQLNLEAQPEIFVTIDTYVLSAVLEGTLTQTQTLTLILLLTPTLALCAIYSTQGP